MQAGVDASVMQLATDQFESRLHAAAAMYVQALHSLPVASSPPQVPEQSPQMVAVDDAASYSIQEGSDGGAFIISYSPLCLLKPTHEQNCTADASMSTACGCRTD